MMTHRQRRRLLIGALLAPLAALPLFKGWRLSPDMGVHDAIRYLNREVFRVAHEGRDKGRNQPS